MSENGINGGIDVSKIGTKAWITPEYRARAKAAADRYADGDIEALFETGRIALRPMGVQVLLRAVRVTDVSSMAIDTGYDARDCISHEVIRVGGAVERYLDKEGYPDDARDKRSVWQRLRAWVSGRGVADGARPRPGDHCFVVTAAADRLSKTDKSVRVWLAHIEDIEGAW